MFIITFKNLENRTKSRVYNSFKIELNTKNGWKYKRLTLSSDWKLINIILIL